MVQSKFYLEYEVIIQKVLTFDLEYDNSNSVDLWFRIW
jgi:hypothetical protein